MDARFRLRRREDFARLRQDGQVFRHALLNLSVIQNDLEHNRYGYITSKQLGNAVKRNRVRRLLREAVRLRHADVRPGFDIVWIARPGLVGKSLKTLLQLVDSLYLRAGVLREIQS
jgi:ribonuclease P protein component